MIYGDVINTDATINVPIAPDRSCSDKRCMNNKGIKLKLLCFFIHLYLQATREMIKCFASLVREDATCNA